MQKITQLPTLVYVGLILTIYSLGVMVGFDPKSIVGDAWDVLAVPYWFDIPAAFNVGARELKRPFQTVYYVTVFEFFGADRVVFHLFSMLLLALGSTLMALVIIRSFPQQKRLAIIAALINFFIPTLHLLTYNLQLDNGRLAMIFFWLSVLVYQGWVNSKGITMRVATLTMGAGLYCISILSYENTTAMFLLIPLFILPQMTTEYGFSPRAWISPLASVMGSLGISLIAFRLIRNYFAITLYVDLHTPTPTNLWDYTQALFDNLLVSFYEFPTDTWLLFMGGLTALLILPILITLPRQKPKTTWNNWLIIAIGLGIIILGTLPFILADYPIGISKYSIGRAYSSGQFGFSIVLAFIVGKLLETRLKYITLAIVVIWFAVTVAFNLRQRQLWQEASIVRENILDSLCEQVPDVARESTILLIDIEFNESPSGVVFQGTRGLNEFIAIVFDDQTVQGQAMYIDDENFVDIEDTLAIANEDGVIARGNGNPSPHDKLIILWRQDDRLVLMDELTPDDPVAIDWRDGVSSIRTNQDNILQGDDCTTHRTRTKNKTQFSGFIQ